MTQRLTTASELGRNVIRVCVVGPGTHFLSGLSYYTIRLANALVERHDVSVVLFRRLLPRRLYPGSKRVGARLTDLTYAPTVRVFDGIDWYWLPSMLRALVFLLRERPDVLVLQWWSGTVLHSHLLLAMAAKVLRARVVIEFHEILDPSETRIALAQAYVRLTAPMLVRLASAFVIHAEQDRPTLEQRYGIVRQQISVIPHGPYDHYQLRDGELMLREAPAGCCNLLFFGLVRPYKGLENLIQAFDSLPPDQAQGYWLTIVGEVWEGWTLPDELIASSRYRERITFVKRYVSDAEVAAYFAGADAVVLPYHRSSGSGSLHVAMSKGLPVVVTNVGGLAEAVVDYEGAIVVPPDQPDALLQALRLLPALQGQRFTDPHSWTRTTRRYAALFSSLDMEPGSGGTSHPVELAA
jgi:glycosyltransferase involved in cell wall biosynthesis